MKKLVILYFILFAVLLFSRCGRPHSDVTLTVRLTESGEPISKYIYGQFTEHLGRCIYGGIWAEMLEDRKFFYPVTEKYQPWGSLTDEYWKAGEFSILVASPWKCVGKEGSVKMTAKNPFTGSHTPEISLGGNVPAGISQEGLYLRKGMTYIGRIVLSSTDSQTTVSISVYSGDTLKINVAEINNVNPDYATYPFTFTSAIECSDATISITGTGTGSYRIGTLSLMPSDNINGFNSSVIASLKELNSPVYRWPGGNFVSGYNWRDGIGDRDKRPPRKNPAWTGIEHNDVGIHEFMDLCALIGAEPYVAVNTGLGTVDEVADQVEFINGNAETLMGRMRSANGHPEPYGVKFWAVGNEMYGEWQLGHMPLNEYVKKHIAVVSAMKKADPAITLVGVGAAGDWSRTMLTQAGDYMDLLSEHIYCHEEKDVAAHVAQLKNNIKRVADVHRKYRDEIEGLASKDIRIAMDEWNYWYGDYLYGELGCRYFWKDGLGVAEGLHEYFRNSDIYYMANYAQTVNVIGAIKTTKKDVQFETTGIILKLYREHFGQVPLKTEGYSGAMDISVAKDTVRNLLTVAVVNADSLAHDFNINFTGGKAGNIESCYEVSNPDPQAYNEPGRDRTVDIQKIEWKFEDYLSVKPMTVMLLKLKLE